MLGLSAAVTLLAGLVVIGWFASVPWLTTLWPGETSVKLNTALCLLALIPATLSCKRRVVIPAVGLVGATAGAVVIGYAFSVDLGLDQLLVADRHAGPNQPGRMALTTALCLLSLAASAVARILGRAVVAQAAAVLPLAAAVLVLLGYAYTAPELFADGALSTVAVPTAFSLLCLATVSLGMVENGLLRWLVQGGDAGALLLRRLLPLPLIALPVLGYLRLKVQDRGLVGAGFGAALSVILAAALMIGVFVIAARRIGRLDRERLETIAQLRVLSSMLKSRMSSGSRDLHQARTMSGDLADRGNLASDMSDRTLQRLYATGLQLTGAARRDPDSQESQRSRDVIGQLDEAIKELRGTIFTLNKCAEEDDLVAGLETAIDQAGRTPGFAPRLVTSGDLARVSPLLASNLLSVVDDVLAHMAGQPGVTTASLTLNLSAEMLELTISDDGVPLPGGIPSDLEIIRARALDLGGHADWSQPVPHSNKGGNTLKWRVPLDTAVIRHLPARSEPYPTGPRLKLARD